MGKVAGGVEQDDTKSERNLSTNTCTLVGVSYIYMERTRDKRGRLKLKKEAQETTGSHLPKISEGHTTFI